MARDRGDDEATVAKRVLETGIALVHEGEVVFPAATSKAQADLITEDARTVVEYHFPVEIEIRGQSETIDIPEIARYVYEQLARRLREGS